MEKFKGIMQKRRHLFVTEIDMLGVLLVLDSIKQESIFHQGLKMEIGKCGDIESDTWLIECKLTNEQWREFIKELNSYDYDLVLTQCEFYYVKERKENEGQK